MANTGFKGINVRQTTGSTLLFDCLLQDAAGELVTTGTTTLYLYELQSDGTIKTFDFSNNIFTSGSVVGETRSMTHRTGNNGTTNTGIWTTIVSGSSAFTAFTDGAMYYARTKSASAIPADQVTKFQFGGFEGDTTLSVIASAIHQASLENNWTHEEAMRVILSAVAAKASGTGATISYRDINDTKDRIVATAAGGERTAITYDKT